MIMQLSYQELKSIPDNKKTFQDHYEMWLIENNKTKEEWDYERWINEWCFKDFGKKVRR